MRNLRAPWLGLAFALIATTAWAQSTWNPADKNANIVLSGGNLIATALIGGDNLVRSTDSKTTGKWYWEVHQDHAGSEDSPGGIGTASESLSNFAGQTTESTGWYSSGQGYCGGGAFSAAGWSSGDVLGLALDLDSSPPTLKMQDVTTGSFVLTFQLTGKGDGHDISAPPWFALADVPGGSSMTVNFGPTFAGSVPSGYSAWNGGSPPPPLAATGAALIGIVP